MKPLFLSASAIAVALCSTAMAEQLINDNLVVTGNMCVGLDCATGDADLNLNGIVLRAGVPKIHFNSSNSTFIDWELSGSATNGGARNFSLDSTRTGGTTTPFIIQGQPPTSSFVMENNGDIGFGTSMAQAELHVVRSAHPALRLEQDTSGGLGHHTWDMSVGNSGFQIVDVGNPFSVVPFTIENGADPGAFHIDATGTVGMGTTTPSTGLHVWDNTGQGAILIEETSAGTLGQMTLRNNGITFFTLEDTSIADAPNTGRKWNFQNQNGTFRVTTAPGGPGEIEMILTPAGDMTIEGALTQNSDKHKKMAIEPVDPAAILQKVAELPVSSWMYKDNAALGIRHIGPMAQDFHAAFDVGASETGISSLDTSGVALAAIQALASENAALRTQAEEAGIETRALKAELDALKRRFAALEDQFAD
ncbi:tail fiber domain-containing protein [Roseovarius faecimaris]|nr:tail fiber domain-containing protein [Roseovarius faecimaris]